MGLLDKLMFWRNDEPATDIAGCFTLPGAELDHPAVDTSEPSPDDDRTTPEPS